MNKRKLKDLNYKGSIHTLSVTSDGMPTADAADKAWIKTSSSKDKDGRIKTTAILNPNSLDGDVFDFSQTMDRIDYIMSNVGLDHYKITRVDLRLDSYNPHDYDRYQKMHKYLIAALAVAFDIKNCYETHNLFSTKSLNVAIKNDCIQMENYDRTAKSKNTLNHAEPATNRLELRTMTRQWRKFEELERPDDAADKEWNAALIRREFLEEWFDRLDRAVELLPKVCERYNFELEMIFWKYKDHRPKQFRTMTDFVMQYQNCIFCRQQMIDLAKRIGSKDPVQFVDCYKKDNGIEFFTKTEMQTVVKKIKEATLKYFDAK